MTLIDLQKYRTLQSNPALLSTHITYNNRTGFCLTFLKGSAFYDVKYFPLGEERKIKALFEAGPSIPWATLKREGEIYFNGRLRL